MCTTIFLKNETGRFVARNMDIFLGLGRLYTNRRRVEKTAFVLPPEPALRWVSQYGSVTFCQVGKESPSGGLNEKGLSVEQMTLPETQYPAPDARPAVKELQWIQYMLDTCATVDEVLKKAKDIRVVNSPSVLHYLACDREGNAAIFEYLNGELAVYSGDDLPVQALANSPYADSLKALRGEQPLPDAAEDAYRHNSLQRFEKAAKRVQSVPQEGDLTEYAFATLEDVSREDTVWSIVYDLQNLRVSFFTQTNNEVRSFELNTFDFDADDLTVDIDAAAGDDLRTQFEPYTFAANRDLIYAFFRHPIIAQVFGSDQFTDEMLDFMAAYPEHMMQGVQ